MNGRLTGFSRVLLGSISGNEATGSWCVGGEYWYNGTVASGFGFKKIGVPLARCFGGNVSWVSWNEAG